MIRLSNWTGLQVKFLSCTTLPSPHTNVSQVFPLASIRSPFSLWEVQFTQPVPEWSLTSWFPTVSVSTDQQFYSLWFWRPLDPSFLYNTKSRNIPSLHFFFSSPSETNPLPVQTGPPRLEDNTTSHLPLTSVKLVEFKLGDLGVDLLLPCFVLRLPQNGNFESSLVLKSTLPDIPVPGQRR